VIPDPDHTNNAIMSALSDDDDDGPVVAVRRRAAAPPPPPPPASAAAAVPAPAPASAAAAAAVDPDSAGFAASRSGKWMSLPGGFRLPARLFTQLFPHQRRGVAWLWSLHAQSPLAAGSLGREGAAAPLPLLDDGAAGGGGAGAEGADDDLANFGAAVVPEGKLAGGALPPRCRRVAAALPPRCHFCAQASRNEHSTAGAATARRRHQL